MDDFLLIILTIPLTDRSLEMDLYKIYNLPALHPKLKVEFTYQLEGEYLAITKNKLYATLPTAGEIRICKGTEGYLCLMNQALYPVEKIEWCAYTLFTQNEDKKRVHCTINTQEGCQQGTKFRGLPMGSNYFEERENADQVSNRHTCNRYKSPINHYICGEWMQSLQQ